MHTIALPQAQKDMSGATVVRWLKRPGEAVKKGETLVELETERARVAVQADRDGTLAEVLAPEGKTLGVGEPLARMEDAEAAETAAEEKAAVPATAKHDAEQLAGQDAEQDQAPRAAPPGDAVPILMPKAGNTMEEGMITEWKARVGDEVNVGDVIFVVETDKASVEVEAVDAGRLARIVVPEGETIEVLRPVAYLAAADADVDAYIASVAEETGAETAAGAVEETVAETEAAVPAAAKQASAPAATTATGRVKASPAARKLAAERGVDLSAAGAGSGAGGRILSTDVPAAVAAGEAIRRKMSPMRKAVARTLSASKQTIPHFYIELTVDAGAMMDLYRAEKTKYDCTVNDVVVKAVAKAVSEFPAFRSRLDGEELVEFPTANIGVAVGVEDGLLVPVLVAAEMMSLEQVAVQTRRIVEGARAGTVVNMGRGVMTVTNLGMFGIERFGAIINPPEASILAVGAVREQILVREGRMLPGRVLTVTLSCDHRVIDGLLAARFLQRLREILETPELLIQ